MLDQPSAPFFWNLHRSQGLHFTEAARAAAPPARAPGLTASASLHTLADVAAVDGSLYDYVFLSPVFDSISKAGVAAAPFPRDALAAALARAAPVPVLALGGVDGANAAAVAAAGFGGAALLGCVWADGGDGGVDALRAVVAGLEAGRTLNSPTHAH